MSKKAPSRVKINELLQEAFWRFYEGKSRKANIVLEISVKCI